MGNSQSESGIKNREVEKLKEKTEFSGSEIREWHQRFHEDYPSGVITKDDFVAMYQQLFPTGDASYFAGNVFKVYTAISNIVQNFGQNTIAQARACFTHSPKQRRCVTQIELQWRGLQYNSG